MNALRIVLGSAESVVAVVLLYGGYNLLTITPSEVGRDGIALGLGRLLGPPFVIAAGGMAITALLAFKGGPRWWIWQIAMPAWLFALFGLAFVAEMLRR